MNEHFTSEHIKEIIEHNKKRQKQFEKMSKKDNFLLIIMLIALLINTIAMIIDRVIK